MKVKIIESQQLNKKPQLLNSYTINCYTPSDVIIPETIIEDYSEIYPITVDLGFKLKIKNRLFSSYIAIVKNISELRKYDINMNIDVFECNGKENIKITFTNFSDKPLIIKKDDLICQLMIIPIKKIKLVD